MKILEMTNVQVSFHMRPIVTDISFTVEQGEIVTLIGPNGAGKSTTLKAALGLINTSSGTVWRKPKLTIGYMPQSLVISELMPLSVGNYLELGKTKVSSSQIRCAMQEIGIAHLYNAPVNRLSGGELQLVLLARAILYQPELLVLDEPARGVDMNGQLELYQLIQGVRERNGCAVLMVSHDLHFVMAGTDKVICINKHMCCSGHPDTVIRDPEFLKLFGTQELPGLAVYTHHHNHKHDITGNIINDD